MLRSTIPFGSGTGGEGGEVEARKNRGEGLEKKLANEKDVSDKQISDCCGAESSMQ